MAIATSTLGGGKKTTGHLQEGFMGDCGKCGARRIDQQIGLESSPDAFVAAMVAVFREVKRVLADDGVCWVNLGDSYTGGGNYRGVNSESTLTAKQRSNGGARGLSQALGVAGKDFGLEPKNLIGIPWRVAFALQQPYYSGTIKRVEDRVWLAAAIDAEGCIFIHKRKTGQSNGQGNERKNDSFGSGLEVANTSEAFVRRCMDITGKGSICHQDGHGRKQRLFRWNLRSNECRDVLREVYPFFVAKHQQARLAIGCPSSGREAEAAHAALIGLHNGLASDVDFKAPDSLFLPGWYLRSDVIWSKSNPMPESVTDRPTKAHEYVFLLTKSERYAYNADAIRLPLADISLAQIAHYERHGANDYVGPKGLDVSINSNNNLRPLAMSGAGARGSFMNPDGANARTVWSIPTEASPYEHFAVMPKALARRCILAGCPSGGTVLDPFAGVATTGVVALEEGRSFVGIELSPKYHAMARERLANVAPLLATEIPA